MYTEPVEDRLAHVLIQQASSGIATPSKISVRRRPYGDSPAVLRSPQVLAPVRLISRHTEAPVSPCCHTRPHTPATVHCTQQSTCQHLQHQDTEHSFDAAAATQGTRKGIGSHTQKSVAVTTGWACAVLLDSDGNAWQRNLKL